MFLSEVVSKLRLFVRVFAAPLRRRGLHLAALVAASMVLIAPTDGGGSDNDFASSLDSNAFTISTQAAEDARRNNESSLRPRSLRIVVAHWAAITDQRRDVLDLRRSDVVRILTGSVRDWSALGGSPVPIAGYLPRSQAGLIATAFGLSMAELAIEVVPDDQIIDLVERTPGAFALVRPYRLRMGVLALTVNGHDPYRDPGLESPLRLVRWIPPPTSADQLPRFFRDFLRFAPPFDPAGLLITGELIPVRCTNHVLEALGDYDAMFDGVRNAILAADLAIAPLEWPLTANKELTPCVETVIFTGSYKAVPAMANAGLDVLLTIGNHMMDCWKGCSGVAALYETLARLRNAGIVTAGAGRDLQSARAPALVSVPTLKGPVSFAFLG
ncbi:MAG: CapA family protein, partial [Chloroflexi bacterium]|nr:CapA family protein [Chloroflexota bacterium]